MYNLQPADLYIINEQFLFNTANLIQIKQSPYIRAIKGTVKLFGEGVSAYPLSGLPNLEEIDLPNCTTIHAGGGYIFKDCTNLHTAKLPSMTNLSNLCLFDGCTALTYLELGALTSMEYRALLRASNIETIIIGKGAYGDLHFEYQSKLTQECLEGIIDAMASGKSSTLNLSSDSYSKITDEYKQIAADKKISLVEKVV